MATLTVESVMDDLHLSRTTVTDYLRAGRIPGGFQPIDGGQWLVDADEYAKWRADRMKPADPHRIEPRSSRSRAAQSRRSR